MKFTCPGELTIATADAVKEGLLACVSGPVMVDFGSVSAVDSAGLQVLVAATKTWARRSLGWQKLGESRALQEAITLSGLSDWWNKWAVGEP